VKWCASTVVGLGGVAQRGLDGRHVVMDKLRHHGSINGRPERINAFIPVLRVNE
jgi:hypothetical protein